MGKKGQAQWGDDGDFSLATKKPQSVNSTVTEYGVEQMDCFMSRDKTRQNMLTLLLRHSTCICGCISVKK